MVIFISPCCNYRDAEPLPFTEWSSPPAALTLALLVTGVMALILSLSLVTWWVAPESMYQSNWFLLSFMATKTTSKTSPANSMSNPSESVRPLSYCHLRCWLNSSLNLTSLCPLASSCDTCNHVQSDSSCHTRSRNFRKMPSFDWWNASPSPSLLSPPSSIAQASRWYCVSSFHEPKESPRRACLHDHSVASPQTTVSPTNDQMLVTDLQSWEIGSNAPN